MFNAMHRYNIDDAGINVKVVGTSESYDKENNWLPFSLKEQMFHQIFPRWDRPAFVKSHDLCSFFKQLEAMSSEYSNLYYFCGPDRVAKTFKFLSDYNGKEFTFKDIVVIPFECSESVRATQMRKAILANDKKTFEEMCPRAYTKGYRHLAWRQIRAVLRDDHGIRL